MPEYVPVRGFKEMENLLKLYDTKRCPIYIYFYGEKDKQGRSWCPDCVAGRWRTPLRCCSYGWRISLRYRSITYFMYIFLKVAGNRDFIHILCFLRYQIIVDFMYVWLMYSLKLPDYRDFVHILKCFL